MPIRKLSAVLAMSVALAAATATGLKAQQPMLIQNDILTVSYDPGAGHFTVAPRNGHGPTVTDGTIPGFAGAARRVNVTDRIFGPGQALEAASANGAGGRIMLFPHLPFALIQAALKNNGADAAVLNRVPVAHFALEPAPGGRLAGDTHAAASFRVLGTGGLTAADANPGSYAWLAIAEPQSRNGVVAGFISYDRASGVLFPKVEGGQITVEARDDYGRLKMAPGATTETETLAVGCFEDARLGLEAWADAVAKFYSIKLPPQPIGFCTWYSEKHGGSSDEKDLAALVDFASKNLKPFGFNFVQIDDGWQRGDSKGNGPRKNFTDFRPDGPYPTGMKAMADTIKAQGLTPGLWFMPFAGTHNDPWFADHQDWFVKHEDGSPYDTAWGGTSIDMTNPAARDYLRSWITHIAKDWGYTYFKMDGLYTGLAAKQVYVNSGYKEDGFGDAVLSNPDKTNIESFRDGLKLVREAAGPQVFILGCTVAQNMRSYSASFGLVNAMRIGADNNGSWNGWRGESPVAGSRNYFLNGRIWYNDPDPEYVRSNIPLEDARTIASWATISGELNSNSDWLPDLPPDRLEILKRTMPSHGRTARPVDLFENDPPRTWTVSDLKGPIRRDVIALYNWDNQPATFDVPLARFGLPPAATYAAFDFWGNAFLPALKDWLTVTLPAHGCEVLAIRPALDRPFLLSTSRHLTQGMVDVLSEDWNARSKTLSGSSLIVGGDPYELRIQAPGVWKASKAELSAEDRAAGADIKLSQDGFGVRALITCPGSRTVHWKVVFNGP